ncbi:MAG: AEC family transporter [Deltaproteobacteria bacterium]
MLIANIVLPVFLIIAVGYLFARFRSINLAPINEFIIYVSTPCLILTSLAEKPLQAEIAGKIFLSVAGVIAGCLGVGYLVVRAMNLPVKTYVPPVLFANTGNMGLPLALFAFGEAGFNSAILYMVFTTIVHYTLGIMILNYGRSRLELFKLPLIYSALAGIILSVSGFKLPISIDRAFSLLGEASIPTMIFALGYKLSEIKLSHVGRSLMFGGIRIALGFAFGIAMAKILHLGGVSSNTVILQSAMPPAIFNFVLAEKYHQDSQTVASIIMAGTLLSIISTPIIIAYLLEGN